ncbi:MAG TPA: redox-regulated ATPase YchF [Clostridiaceae bacterium]|nr:redox-regulated ATPase YchF [Clostridiaceae bacterium]
MKIGLIGLPMTGKTTFYNLLTNTAMDSSGSSYGRTEAQIGISKVPDPRIDFLSSIYKPKKTIYATIEVTDIKGVATASSLSKSSGPNPFLESVRQVDALVHVVRAFKSDDVVHIEGSIDPIRDIETINIELLFADLAIVENRISRIETSKKITKDMIGELEVLKKCREALENEKLINSINLTEEEKQHLKSFSFLTERPLVLLVNLDEEQFTSREYYQKEKVMKYAEERQIPVLEICAKTELEINELEDEDKVLFMEDLGIKETGISKLAGTMYEYLGLISFITVGEDEVRAWPVRKGITAKAAAGKVHSDIERGFIRAEVVSFDDFKKYGSIQKVRENGLFRLEGKEYIVQDGDIINFRFNI